MRLTEFWERMERQFGKAFADTVARDQVLGDLGNRTVNQALAAGTDAKEVWRAVCDAYDLPPKVR